MQPVLVKNDGEELIENDKETSTRRRSVSSDRREQREGLRGDKKEANYGGERISFSFKSKCGCLALKQERNLMRTILCSVLSLLMLRMSPFFAVEDDYVDAHSVVLYNAVTVNSL